MSAFISKKLSFVLLLCSWCTALAITLLFNYILAGPRLGPVYDTLLGFRRTPPVSGEILLIETDEIIEPNDIFSVLMALSEMGAADLLVEVPLSGTGPVITESGLEFSYRINDEFKLVSGNIRALFESIRLGLISPVESPVYVERVVELAEQGRDRLNAAVIRQDEPGSVLAAQSAEVFGRAITAVDLRPISSGDIPWYSRPRPDRDGVLRRIAPSAEADHIVYRALRPRWEKSEIEQEESGLFLVNSFAIYGEGFAYRFPLDKDGNILIEKQKPGKNDFRRLTLNHFRDYDQTGRILARLLKDAEDLGVYAGIIPERIPHLLYDYAENLKEEMLKNPSEQGKCTDWINAREEYIAGLDAFLYGPSEMNLVNGYEELIAGEGLSAEGVVRLQGLRDELIRAFAAMRERYGEFIEMRALLAQVIDSSFCIMGPFQEGATAAADRIDITESSALLANALLTGACITPGQNRYIVLWSFSAAFIVLVFIHALRPVWLLVFGLALTLLCGAGFGVNFIISLYWIDPFISMAACLGGILVLAVSRFSISYGRAFRFRLAYGGKVNNDMLKLLLRTGRPRLSETLCTNAAIIAVKNPGMSGREDQKAPLEAAKAAAEFRTIFSRLFKQEGALILGFENDIALACFGSPPERICHGKEKIAHPAERAVICIRDMLNTQIPRNKNSPAVKWQFGIESGECVFSWSAETGYIANGRPAVRARIFASLTARYEVQAIIGESAKDSINLPARKLSSLAGENFYRLPV